MEKLSKTEMQAVSLDRARSGQSLMNYPAIYSGFMAKGIAEADIKPRENIFTFNAWKALGRSVKRGEHGVKVCTWINVAGEESADGEESEGYRIPKTSTVFHITQTELTSEREARLAREPEGKFRNRRRYGNYKARLSARPYQGNATQLAYEDQCAAACGLDK